MAVIYVDVEQRSKYIMLGEQGEKNAVVVKFDISTWLSAFGSGGSAFVDVERPGDATAYTKQIGLEGNYAVWSVDDIDNAVAGKGKVQLTYLMPGDDGRSKTATFVTMVDKSLDASGDVPDPYESYLEEAREIRAETTQNAQTAQAAAQAASTKAGEASTSASEAYTSARSAKRSEENAERSASTASEAAEEILGMTATATTLPEGSSATVNYSNGVMAFGIPRGDKGAKGDRGETGETGATPQMSIGTVETLAPDEDATATITGTAENPVLNFGIPKGETGDVSKSELASLMPLETVSGSVASFSDGSHVFDAEQALVTLEPVQDLHGYDKPWVGGAGKNKMPTIVGGSNRGITAVVNADGSVTLNGTANGAAQFYSEYFTVKAGTYYITCGTPERTVVGAYLDEVSGSASEGARLTFSEDTRTRGTVLVYSGQTVSNVTLYPMLRFESETDATYEPYSNICPISGHDSASVVVAGRNLFDKNDVFVGYIDDSDGSINPSTSYKCTDFIKVSPNESYYIKSEQTNGMWGAWYDAEKNYVSGFTGYANAVITAPNNAHYVRLTILTDRSGNIDTFAVNYPSTDHEYHAYQRQTYTTSLGRTVYGGTVDLVSGVLTVDRAMVTLDGSEDEQWAMLGSGSASAYAMRIAIADFGFKQSVVTTWSNYLESLNNNQTWGNYDAFISSTMVSSTVAGVVTGIRTITSVADWRTYLASNPLQVVYTLATPQTYQLTPQAIALLTGDNNVWSDSGQIQVKYRANIGLYVDKKISEVSQ